MSVFFWPLALLLSPYLCFFSTQSSFVTGRLLYKKASSFLSSALVVPALRFKTEKQQRDDTRLENSSLYLDDNLAVLSELSRLFYLLPLLFKALGMWFLYIRNVLCMGATMTFVHATILVAGFLV